MDVFSVDQQVLSALSDNSTNATCHEGSGFPHHVVIASIYIATTAFGVVGNGLVIMGVALSPKLQTPTNVLIVNLAIADLLTCAALPFQTVGVLSERDQFPLPDVVCTIVGSVIYVTFACSGINLVLIAIIRCYVITKSIRGKVGLNTRRKQIALALMAWVLACISIYVPVFGFQLTTFSYYPPYGQCFTSPSPRSNAYHGYLAMLIGIMVTVILACYLRILVFLRKQHNQFRVHFGSSRSRRLHRAAIKRMGRREVRVTKNLFIVFMAFVVCTLPTTIAFIIPDVLSIGLYTTAVLYLNNCLNPILYAYKHPVFKSRFLALIKRFLVSVGCSRKVVQPPVRTISAAFVYAMNVSQYPVTLKMAY
ncbi:adenosine receptor A3-like [Diadema setosum]|uniref:adenosine receptor A3-like n=1 Tax=Diadema setosum TaxID=31175 RepID=UPI003B3B5329